MIPPNVQFCTRAWPLGTFKLTFTMWKTPSLVETCEGFLPVLFTLFSVYLILVQCLRYRRTGAITASFLKTGRSLSSMTTKEAHDIIAQLQELEFPSAFAKARRIALLKVGNHTRCSQTAMLTEAHRRAVYLQCPSCSPSRDKIRSAMRESAQLIPRFFLESRNPSIVMLIVTRLPLRE